MSVMLDSTVLLDLQDQSQSTTRQERSVHREVTVHREQLPLLLAILESMVHILEPRLLMSAIFVLQDTIALETMQRKLE